jgi:Spy/CpxP family protein refolding chaperone
MKRYSKLACLITLTFACLYNIDSAFSQRGGKLRNPGQRIAPGEGQELPPRQKQRKFERRTLGGIAGVNPDMENRPYFNPRIAALQKARPRLVLEALNLTPVQQARVREIHAAHEEEVREIGGRLRAARNALDRALMGNIYNEIVIKEHTEELVAAQSEQIRMNARMRAEIRKLLTPEQVRRFHEKNREIQRQINQIKLEELSNQTNRPQNQPPDREKDGEFDLLQLFQ